jgi:hypothetical protein
MKDKAEDAGRDLVDRALCCAKNTHGFRRERVSLSL